MTSLLSLFAAKMAPFLRSVLIVCLCRSLYAEITRACGDPPLVEKAIISTETNGKNYTVDSVVTYSCESGYVVKGTVRSSECLISENLDSNPQWTPTNFTCIRRSCGDPGYVNHAYMNGSLFTFGNTVTYECEEGYRLVGQNLRYCLATGLWSGRLPSCERIFCQAPPDPADGKVAYESLEYGSELQYTCNKGFRLTAGRKRSCSVHGRWSGEEPSCTEAECDVLHPPEHGTVKFFDEKPRIGSIAVFACNDNRELVGLRTSKCLDDGKWTFSTPYCVDPCRIPIVENGEMGKYLGYSFKQIESGTTVKEGAEIYLRCSQNYEPLGQPQKEVKIICTEGQWSVLPSCLPKACRTRPPIMRNARIKNKNLTARSNGTTVVYICNKGFMKAATGNVTCKYGIWIGKQPVCKETRCYTGLLTFPGLIHHKHFYYFHGEIFQPKCGDGYDLSKKENNFFTCDSGEWIVNFPPCKAVPCHLDDLRKSRGVNLTDKSPTESGTYADIMCEEGYSLKHAKPLCENGKWKTKHNFSPCQPSDCRVPNVPFGEIYYEDTVFERTFLKPFGVEKKVHKKAALDSIYEHRSELFIFCEEPYTFQGRVTSGFARITCNYGKWNPDPFCSKIGASEVVKEEHHISKHFTSTTRGIGAGETTELISENVRNYTVMPLWNNSFSEAATVSFLNVSITTEKEIEVEFSDKESVANVKDDKNCFCVYNLEDENVLAFVDDERLKFGDKVKYGNKVQFRCKEVGRQRLHGPSVLECINCYWHSTVFPSCNEPGIDNVYILVYTHSGKPLTAASNGSFIIAPKSLITLRCATKNQRSYTHFESPVKIKLEYYTEWLPKERRYEIGSFITLRNIDPSYSGRYICNRDDYYDSHYIDIIVEETYCPVLIADDFIEVIYEGNRKPQTSAKLHCIKPGMKIIGESRINCLDTGKWSAKPPTCAMVNCSMDMLFDVIPKGIEPVMVGVFGDSFSYGTALNLTCEKENHHLIGNSTAVCDESAKWIVHDMRCIQGCGPVMKPVSSYILIEPQKDFYRFGESVSFLCPPGQILKSNIERMMCLTGGWSEDVIPNCIDVK